MSWNFEAEALERNKPAATAHEFFGPWPLREQAYRLASERWT